VARFRAQALEVLGRVRHLDLPPVTLVTGISAAGELQKLCLELGMRCGVPIEVIPVPNRFFGGAVSVAGLLTGRDILTELAGKVVGTVLLPDVLLREGTDLLLDDMTVAELEGRLSATIEVVPSEPWGLWDALETLALERETRRKHA
jgi:NifB/MoaA-like Fe-S oxidoreductase